MIVAELSLAQSTSNNDVSLVNSTTINVGIKGEKNYSIDFPVGTSIAPYSLVIKNGSGLPIEKKVCSGNLVQKLLCVAANLIADLKMATERVALAEVVLNGQKIVTGKDLNLTVASLQLPLQLKSSNKIQIRIVGLPTASLTFEVKGKSAALKGTLAISSPASNSTVSSDSVSLVGRVVSTAPNLKVTINNGIEIPNVVSGQDFSFIYNTLIVGKNDLYLNLYSGSTLLDSKLVSLNLIPEGSAGSLIGSAGGVINVSDSSSEVFGSSIQVPANAVDGSRVLVLLPPDISADLPFGVVALGSPVYLEPFLIGFSSPATLSVPYQASRIPSGALSENIKVYGYNGKSWEALAPKSISSDLASISVSVNQYYAYQAGIEAPVNPGELQVNSSASGATVYVDGLFKGDLAPVTLQGISDGDHIIKVYAPGYNEIQQTISYPAVKRLNLELVPQDITGPVVQFDSAISDGMYVSDNLMEVKGKVTLPAGVSSQGFVVLSQNARDIVQPLSADGLFSFIIPLFGGENIIQVRATVNNKTGMTSEITVNQGSQLMALGRMALQSSSGVGSLAASLDQDDNSVRIRNEKLNAINDSKSLAKSASISALAATEDRLDQEIKVILTWGKDKTDVDLHIYDDYGGHAWYGALGGIEEGTLDRDDVDGFGPEIFTLARPRPGKYRVRVHYFSDHQNGPTTATIQVFLAGQVVFQGSQALSSGGSWEAFTLDVQGISISKVASALGNSKDPMRKECQAYANYPCKNQIFTSLANESSIAVTTTAPEYILDSQIRYEVKELGSGVAVPVTATGRNITFQAVSQPLTGLTGLPEGKPLMFEVKAKTDGGLESAPYYIVQDVRSQIRQEYVDKRKFQPNFARATPTYSQIINASAPFAGPNFYTFQEMIDKSDYTKHGVGVISRSIQYANSANSAYLSVYPSIGRLIKSSTWRNPRKNDRLPDSVIDSFHQTGDAMDVLTEKPTAGTPNGNEIQHEKNLMELCNIAADSMPSSFVLYHAGHVHIEPGTGRNCVAKKFPLANH